MFWAVRLPQFSHTRLSAGRAASPAWRVGAHEGRRQASPGRTAYASSDGRIHRRGRRRARVWCWLASLGRAALWEYVNETPHNETPSHSAAPTELWTWHEIAAFFHRGRTATFELLRSPGFPQPIELTGAGADRLWDSLEVRDFAASRRGAAARTRPEGSTPFEDGSLDEIVVKVPRRRPSAPQREAA